jgi:hypothetical protein
MKTCEEFLFTNGRQVEMFHSLSEFQKQGTAVWKQGSVHILLLIEAELLLFPQICSIICLSFLIWNNKCLKIHILMKMTHIPLAIS